MQIQLRPLDYSLSILISNMKSTGEFREYLFACEADGTTAMGMLHCITSYKTSSTPLLLTLFFID